MNQFSEPTNYPSYVTFWGLKKVSIWKSEVSWSWLQKKVHILYCGTIYVVYRIILPETVADKKKTGDLHVDRHE